MIYNQAISKQVAHFLLDIKAVILKPDEPFTWASGWKSPIYCDNRMLLSYPDIRTEVKNLFTEVIKYNFPQADLIAGVATAGIAHAALIADKLSLPMVYIRSKPKDHGTGRLIEGNVNGASFPLVIEDLISTGKSSIEAANHLKPETKNSIYGLLSVFDYGFQVAKDLADQNNIKVYSLSDYDTLIEVALEAGYITPNQLESLNKWKVNPSQWNP
jgi:orotate phosphoribosyltransferase